MLLAMRTDRALRPGRRRIVDDAVSINGEVDHAVPRLEKDLRLRSRHRLVGDEVAELCPTQSRTLRSFTVPVDIGPHAASATAASVMIKKLQTFMNSFSPVFGDRLVKQRDDQRFLKRMPRGHQMV
jgi:hypothetical protein